MSDVLPAWILEPDRALREVTLSLGDRRVADWEKVLLYLAQHGSLERVTAVADELEQPLRRLQSLGEADLREVVKGALRLEAVMMNWVVDGRMFRFYLLDDSEVAFDMLPNPSDHGQLMVFRRLCEALTGLLDRTAVISHEHGDYPPVEFHPSPTS